MATEQPVPDVKLAQIWYVPVSGQFGFLGEVTYTGDEAVAFIIHAVLGSNICTGEDLLGQVIVVPRRNPLWRLLSGPR